MSNTMKGYLCVILSAVIFGFGPIAAKIAYANGGTPFTVLLCRYLAIPLLFGTCRIRGCSMAIERGQLKKMVVLALMGTTLTPLFTLNAYQLLSSGTTTTIHYLYCMFILLGCVLLYRDPFDIVKGICVAMCVGGVFLLYAPDGKGSPLGFAFALGSAVTYAAYVVYLDKSGMHEMSGFKLQFYLYCISLLCLLPYGALTGQLHFEMNALGWTVSVLYYVVCSQIAGLLFQRGVHWVGSQRSAIFSTLEPITSVLVGIGVFGEAFNLRIGVGVVIILAATVIVTVFHSKPLTISGVHRTAGKVIRDPAANHALPEQEGSVATGPAAK